MTPPEIDSDAARATPLGTIAAFLGEWLPIAGAVGLLVHLSWLGLRPALVERDRLDGVHTVLSGETAALEERLRELELLERALDDPIYRERLHWIWRLEGSDRSSGAVLAQGELGAGSSR